jgi:hypothetical protein
MVRLLVIATGPIRPSSEGSNKALLGEIGDLGDFPFAITNRFQSAK